MKKLLFLITEDWYFWSHRLSLAKTAQAKGYDVHVAVNITQLGREIAAQGFHVHPIDFKRKSKNPFVAFITIFRLIVLYWRERPDIVHHVAMKPILYGTVAAIVTQRKVIINALAGLGVVFIGQGRKWNILRKFVIFSFRILFSAKACNVIFQNPDDNSIFMENKIIAREKSFLIRGAGVDINCFQPVKKDEKSKSSLRIVLVSRMLWDKGIGELVEAAKILKSLRNNPEIILAGIPDPANPASIPVETLKTWHDQGIIKWLGHVEEVAALLQQCHIAVLPSYREGLPKSLLEAASVGLPLVATDVPGCREIVRHEVNGFLVKVKDPLSLAKALEKLLNDGELRKRFGHVSREIVLREFAEEHVISQTLSLYEELAC